MPKAKAPREVDVQVVARVYTAETLFLRMHCGTANEEGVGTYNLSTDLGTGAPIVELPDGRWVSFSWSDIVTAAKAAGARGIGEVLSEGYRKRGTR